MYLRHSSNLLSSIKIQGEYVCTFCTSRWLRETETIARSSAAHETRYSPAASLTTL